MKRRFIIISGPSCTGKTTLAQRIAKKFWLPYFGKDTVKELLFNSLGWKDRGWSKRIGSASYALLFAIAEQSLRSGQPFIIEANFKPKMHTPRFQALKRKYPFHSLEVNCRADGRVLIERFVARSASSRRHPGHVDQKNLKEFRSSLMRGLIKPMTLGGQVLLLDTSDFQRVSMAKLYQSVRKFLEA